MLKLFFPSSTNYKRELKKFFEQKQRWDIDNKKLYIVVENNNIDKMEFYKYNLIYSFVDGKNIVFCNFSNNIKLIKENIFTPYLESILNKKSLPVKLCPYLLKSGLKYVTELDYEIYGNLDLNFINNTFLLQLCNEREYIIKGDKKSVELNKNNLNYLIFHTHHSCMYFDENGRSRSFAPPSGEDIILFLENVNNNLRGSFIFTLEGIYYIHLKKDTSSVDKKISELLNKSNELLSNIRKNIDRQKYENLKLDKKYSNKEIIEIIIADILSCDKKLEQSINIEFIDWQTRENINIYPMKIDNNLFYSKNFFNLFSSYN